MVGRDMPGSCLDGRPPCNQLNPIRPRKAHEAGIMDVVTLVVFVGSIFLAAGIAERRGRSVKSWAWVAAFIGPLALPLVFLFPNLHGER